MTTRSIGKLFRGLPTMEGAVVVRWMPPAGSGVTYNKRPPGRPFKLYRIIMEKRGLIC